MGLARAAAATMLAASLLFARTARAAQQPPTLTDQRGKTLVFAEPARRVVTIAIPLFWTFLTVDASDARVVGANSVAMSQMRDGIVARVFPHAASITTEITRGGTFTPNIEALLALRTDAVFQWADRGDELINALERVGLRAIGVKNTSSESDIELRIQMCGVVAGQEARAGSIIRWMQDGNKRYDSLTAAISAGDRPRVLTLDQYSRALQIEGPTSYSTPMLRRAGAQNAATSDGNVGLEEALAWNPDVILLSAFEAKTPADLMADPRWGKTKAAHDRRVYKLPFGVTRWGGFGPESPLFLAWLTNLLQPNRFSIPLRNEMRAAYRTLFEFDATDADLDRVLQWNENAASAGYERFAKPTTQ
jgi:iron complex transport system substrate-binding protein